MNQELITRLFELLKNTNDSKDVPVSSLVFKNDQIVGSGYNTREKTKEISDHAEINAINNAMAKLNITNLSGYNLITTLEPCAMCYSAIKQSKITEIYYLVENPKNKDTRSLSLHDKTMKMTKIGTKEEQEKYKGILNKFFSNEIRK